MTTVSESFVGIIARILGSTDAVAWTSASQRPWAIRGVRNAVARLLVTSTDETELTAVWSLAFEAGALQALRSARVVLSDPQCRGRELEALKLVEDGLGHVAVIAALQALKGDQAGKRGAVVAFPSNGGRT